MLWVQYRGTGIPHFNDQGLERLRQNPLNQWAFQEGRAIEVTHAEEQALRSRYDSAIERTIPPVWR
jgi:hypothetical protein